MLFEGAQESWPWKAIKGQNKGESNARLIYKNSPKLISAGGWNFNTFGSGLFKENFTTIINQIKNKNFNYDKTKIIISDRTNFSIEMLPDKTGKFSFKIWEKVKMVKISASYEDFKFNKTYNDIKFGENKNISFFFFQNITPKYPVK